MYTSIHAYLYAYIHLLYLVIKTFIQSSVATSEGCLKFKGNSRTMVIRHLLKVIELFFFVIRQAKRQPSYTIFWTSNFATQPTLVSFHPVVCCWNT